MRVVVDRDRCEDNAVCVRIAPEVLTLDDDEYAMVTADPVPVEQETLAEQAIAECPRAALLAQRLGGSSSGVIRQAGVRHGKWRSIPSNPHWAPLSQGHVPASAAPTTCPRAPP